MDAKLELLFRHLGISLDALETSTVISDLYQKLESVSKIAEFNALLIHEMIKSDLIPPIILKRTHLLSNIKTSKNKIDGLSTSYELLKKSKAPEEHLDKIAKEMLTEHNSIEAMETELRELSGDENKKEF